MMKRVQEVEKWWEHLDALPRSGAIQSKYSGLVLIPAGTSSNPSTILVGYIGPFAEVITQTNGYFNLRYENMNNQLYIGNMFFAGRAYITLRIDGGVIEIYRNSTYGSTRISVKHPHSDIIATLPATVTNQEQQAGEVNIGEIASAIPEAQF